MGKADYKIELIVTGRSQGERYEKWYDIDAPLDLLLQRYEKLSALQLREALNDLQAEADRRGGGPAVFDPEATQLCRKESP